jgi:hypothetical protein
MATETQVSEPEARDAAAGGTLDWEAFCARFYPGKRERHDFEALVAFEAYRRDAQPEA